MRYIDLALIDKKDPDVIGWLNKARLYLNELSKKNNTRRTKRIYGCSWNLESIQTDTYKILWRKMLVF